MIHKGKKLYEGKAKIIYEGPEKGTGIQHFKDDPKTDSLISVSFSKFCA